VTPKKGSSLPRPPKSLDRHPVAVYLAGLAPGSRRSQRAALRVVAMVVHPETNELTLPWGCSTSDTMWANPLEVAERFALATANRTIAAPTGTGVEAKHARVFKRAGGRYIGVRSVLNDTAF
jgi:hypothetical protein